MGRRSSRDFALTVNFFEKVDVRGVPFWSPDFEPREWNEICQLFSRIYSSFAPGGRGGKKTVSQKKRVCIANMYFVCLYNL